MLNFKFPGSKNFASCSRFVAGIEIIYSFSSIFGAGFEENTPGEHIHGKPLVFFFKKGKIPGKSKSTTNFAPQEVQNLKNPGGENVVTSNGKLMGISGARAPHCQEPSRK